MARDKQVVRREITIRAVRVIKRKDREAQGEATPQESEDTGCVAPGTKPGTALEIHIKEYLGRKTNPRKQFDELFSNIQPEVEFD